jgi:hypothetical protein
MGRVVRFSVVNESGAPAPGQTIASASFEVTTNVDGQAQALLDDEDTSITLNGVVIYKGPIEALKPREEFTTTGERR